MSVREYIGARYVPLFMGEWDNANTYEPLSIVMHEGNSYTSRQFVPAGVAIDNSVYWAETGNYNAQIEQYRQEVNELADTVSDMGTSIEGNQAGIAENLKKLVSDSIIDTALPIIRFNTPRAYGIQGGCSAEINGNMYILFYAENGSDGWVYLYNEANVEIAKLNYYCEHGNSAVYRNGKFYVAGGGHENVGSNNVYVFNVTATTITYAETLVFPLGSTWGFTIDGDGNYIVSSGDDMYVFTPNDTQNYTRIFRIEKINSRYEESGGASFNGLSFDTKNNRLITLNSSISNVAAFYDYDTGKLLKTIFIDSLIGYIINNETEWFDIRENGDVYFCANPQRYDASIADIVYTVLKTNIYNPIGINSHCLDDRLYENMQMFVGYTSTDIPFPTMSRNANVSCIEDLLGFVAMATRNGKMIQVSLNADVTEPIDFIQGAKIRLIANNHTFPLMYYSNCWILLEVGNNSPLFDEQYWTGSYLIGARNSITILNLTAPSNYAPTKKFLNATQGITIVRDQSIESSITSALAPILRG